VVYWSVRRPVAALREIPKNWLRQAFCVDVYAPPEIVPGEDTYVNEIGFMDASGTARRIRTHAEIITFRKVFLPKSLQRHFDQLKVRTLGPFDREPADWKFRLIQFAFGLFVFAPAYLVPLAYRVSLKATCIVYVPFV
jgi:hypothetical protein